MIREKIQAFEKQLEQAETNTVEYVDALNSLSWSIWGNDIDRARRLVNQAAAMAKDLGYERGFAFAQRGMGMLAYGKGDVEESLGHLLPALQWFLDNGDLQGEGEVRGGLSYIYWGFGDFRRGFDEAERALTLAREHGDADDQGWMLSALGGFYHDWNDHEQSLENYREARALFEETGNTIGQARAVNGIGNACTLLGEYEQALGCHNESLALHETSDNPFGAAKVLNDIGLTLQGMGRNDEALEYHQKSLAIRESADYLQGLATCLLDIANIHIVQRNYDDASRMLNRALVTAEQVKSKPKMRRAHELFSNLYRDLGKFDQAMMHFENYHRITEEVFNEDFEQKLKNLRAAHEIEATEREAEIYRLKNVELHDTNEQLTKTLDELRTTQAQLLQDGKMAALGGLVAGIVHEMNTPIGAIMSSADTTLRAVEKLYAELFPDGDVEGGGVRSVIDVLHMNARNTLNSAERIETISKSLKNFARLDEAPFQHIDVHEGIDSTLTLIGPEIHEDVAVVRQYGELPRVFAYPSELNQVFMNILLNAAQALKDRGRITIRTWAENGRILVEIADDGKGIPAEKLGHLFEPGFTRKYATVRMRTGLYTSYNIVRNHLGDLTVKSEVGKGTTFLVSIPDNLEKQIGGAAA